MYDVKSEVLNMQFSIDSIVLWPRNKAYSYKRIPFEKGKINIITGASRTGKSAVIPIIDYCLCSEKCTIPVKTIRNACEWFGVLFDLGSEKLLLCRKEPGNNESTGEMFFLRGDNIIIPERIDSNTTSPQIKNMLNELFCVSFLKTDTTNDHYSARPSFRDFMAFLFQPQNIIANADVLFYKADTTEHREKLIKIFPYILGALTPDMLSAKQEIEYLIKRKDKLNKSLKNIKDVSERWKQELHSWISQAREFGLTNYIWNNSDAFAEQVNQLRLVSQQVEDESTITSENIKNASEELVLLRKEEQDISEKLFSVQKRYTEMQQLAASVSQYDNSLQIQLKRLDLSGWLRSIAAEDGTCPLCGSTHANSNILLDDLCNAMHEIEKTAGNMQTVPAAFEREIKLTKEEIDRYSESLSSIRKRLNEQSGKFQVNNSKKFTLENVSRFLGKVEMIVQTYDRIGTDSELEQEINEINSRIKELRNLVNEDEVTKKIESAISYIQLEASKIIKELDIERPDDPIEIIYKDLTVRIKSASGRDDYLWEIGSASNWLSYHIATFLAFQKYFQLRGNIALPNIIIFDQPSQVYFPQYWNKNNSDEEEFDLKDSLNDEDREGVKKVFKAFSKYVFETKSNIQIIVMEHADEEIWGDIENTHLVARWRSSLGKLVPAEWTNNTDEKNVE
jgi:hypothetical protein